MDEREFGRKIDGVKVPTRSASPYSSDLAPSDYYLFPNMKKWLAGRRFYSNEEVIAETNAFCRVGPILLFGRNQQTGAALDEVYKPKRRLR